MPITLGEIL